VEDLEVQVDLRFNNLNLEEIIIIILENGN
jgi:hypothetical protein